MQYLRMLSGAFVGAGALILLWKGEYTLGGTLLGTMLGFFVGEANGAKKAEKE
jgi:hypothetical protein